MSDIDNSSQPPCEMLDWDSKIFNFPIARVQNDLLTPDRVKGIDDWCKQKRIRCLYLLASANDGETITLAERHGFHFVDIRMTYEQDLSGMPGSKVEITDGIVIRSSHPNDLCLLQRMAEGSFQNSRFYFDNNFPKKLSDLLFATWVKKSCQGYAEMVFVAEMDVTPCGFISCHLDHKSNNGIIGLVGISPQVRGRGLGKTLVFTALDWFRDQGLGEVLVVTQGRNIIAQRLYQHCGFRTKDVQLWYHKWYQV